MVISIFRRMPSIKKHKGFFLALAPFVLMALAGFSAFVIDLGMMRVARAQLQIATDSAALAAANALINGNEAAVNAANAIINQNSIVGDLNATDISIQLGTWDINTRVFTPTNTAPVAARVTAAISPSLFFANFFTSTNYTITTESTAALRGGR